MNWPNDAFWLIFDAILFGVWLTAAIVFGIVDLIRRKKQ